MSVAPVLRVDQFVQPQPEPNHGRERLETIHHQWTVLPGAANCIWTPIDVVTTAGAWVRAHAAGDAEGKYDAGLRLAGMPMSILNALGSLLTFLLEIGYVLEAKFLTELKPIVDLLSIPIMGLGLGLCVIEGIYEGICLRRTVDLLQNMETSELHVLNDAIEQYPERNAELLDRKRVLLVQNLTYFQREYFINNDDLARINQVALRHFPTQDDPARERDSETLRVPIRQNMARALEQVKQANLDRRVRPWCGQEIARQLTPLLEGLQAGDVDAIAEAEALLATVDVQAHKKLLIHIVGLAAIILCAVGFILTIAAGAALFACPATLPLALITTAGILSLLSYVYAKGTLDERGWSFSITKAIPPIGWIYDRFHSCCVEDVELPPAAPGFSPSEDLP